MAKRAEEDQVETLQDPLGGMDGGGSEGWWRLRVPPESEHVRDGKRGWALPGVGLCSGGAVLGGRNAKEWTTRRAEVDTPEFKVPGTQAKGAGQASHLGSFMIFELHLNHVL